MARIWQVTWLWSGTTGGIGYSNLYYQANVGDGTEAFAACNKSRSLFAGVAPHLPPAVKLSLSSDVRLIEDTDGGLVNIFTVIGPSDVPGTALAGPISGASGGVVEWLTGALHGKHLMVGKTFMVPLANNAYDENGTLSTAAVADLNVAGDAMRNAAGPVFGVWGRPRKAKTVGGVTIPALVGMFAPAIASRTPDKAVVLRSRRD